VKCPILLTLANTQTFSTRAGDCLRSDCAWWTRRQAGGAGCALCVLADRIDDLAAYREPR
jgi:hypothetical protein